MTVYNNLHLALEDHLGKAPSKTDATYRNMLANISLLTQRIQACKAFYNRVTDTAT